MAQSPRISQNGQQFAYVILRIKGNSVRQKNQPKLWRLFWDAGVQSESFLTPLEFQ